MIKFKAKKNKMFFIILAVIIILLALVTILNVRDIVKTVSETYQKDPTQPNAAVGEVLSPETFSTSSSTSPLTGTMKNFTGWTLKFAVNSEYQSWKYNPISQTITYGTTTLKIGDRVNDTGTQTVSGFDGKWRVLGFRNGQILLTTDTYAVPFTAADLTYAGTSYETSDGKSQLKIDGVDGYNNGVNALNALGARFNNSKLEGGRSINVDDVNRLTGYNPNNTGVYDPNQTGTGTKCKQGQVQQYGNHVTHKMKNGKLWYSTNYVSGSVETNGSWTETTETNYKPFGLSTNLANGEYRSVDTTSYQYYGDTLTENSTGNTVGVVKGSSAYEMLFGTVDNYRNYWLASSCVNAESYKVHYTIRVLHDGYVGWAWMWKTTSGSGNYSREVRAVVSLKSDIIPTFVSTDSTTGISTFTI